MLLSIGKFSLLCMFIFGLGKATPDPLTHYSCLARPIFVCRPLWRACNQLLTTCILFMTHYCRARWHVHVLAFGAFYFYESGKWYWFASGQHGFYHASSLMSYVTFAEASTLPLGGDNVLLFSLVWAPL